MVATEMIRTFASVNTRAPIRQSNLRPPAKHTTVKQVEFTQHRSEESMVFLLESNQSQPPYFLGGVL